MNVSIYFTLSSMVRALLPLFLTLTHTLSLSPSISLFLGWINSTKGVSCVFAYIVWAMWKERCHFTKIYVICLYFWRWYCRAQHLITNWMKWAPFRERIKWNIKIKGWKKNRMQRAREGQRAREKVRKKKTQNEDEDLKLNTWTLAKNTNCPMNL